ncbi:MAG: YceD family protein [Candidatus Promineifilaceae bacterium]
MSSKKSSRLRFNFGFMLEADLGTSREMEIDYPEVQIEDVNLMPLKGAFQIIRSSKGLYVSGELFSSVEAECSRCLEPVQLPISIQLDDLFYYPAAEAPEGEFGVGEDGFIDLNPLVRQISLLDIPIQPICRPDCQGLCQECGSNLNFTDCGCVEDDVDPRLESLRSLLNSEGLASS